MERAGTSTERTPLVQPTYVFESSLSRRYRKRLRNCQCAVCISLLVLFSVILLVTVSYNLANDIDDDDNSTFVPLPIPLVNVSGNLTSSQGLNLTVSSGNASAADFWSNPANWGTPSPWADPAYWGNPANWANKTKLNMTGPGNGSAADFWSNPANWPRPNPWSDPAYFSNPANWPNRTVLNMTGSGNASAADFWSNPANWATPSPWADPAYWGNPANWANKTKLNMTGAGNASAADFWSNPANWATPSPWADPAYWSNPANWANKTKLNMTGAGNASAADFWSNPANWATPSPWADPAYWSNPANWANKTKLSMTGAGNASAADFWSNPANWATPSPWADPAYWSNPANWANKTKLSMTGSGNASAADFWSNPANWPKPNPWSDPAFWSNPANWANKTKLSMTGSGNASAADFWSNPANWATPSPWADPAYWSNPANWANKTKLSMTGSGNASAADFWSNPANWPKPNPWSDPAFWSNPANWANKTKLSMTGSGNASAADFWSNPANWPKPNPWSDPAYWSNPANWANKTKLNMTGSGNASAADFWSNPANWATPSPWADPAYWSNPANWANKTKNNLTSIEPNLLPVINQKWPLEGKPSYPWPYGPPSPRNLTEAIAAGKAALAKQKKAEALRKSLTPGSPAHRAQRAAATGAEVKPLADAAYAAEEATRALVNGFNPKLNGGVGIGPATNGSFLEPPYCWDTTPLCPKSKFRTQDGSCNNLAQPLRWGVSRTPFRRVLPADYGDGISSPRTGVDGGALPSARDVSVTVHRPSYAHDISFTVMLAVWGQFIDHDITATALSKGENGTSLSCCDPSQPPHPACFPVPLAAEDPFYQQFHVTCMEFVRSAPAPTCHFGPRQQMNQATAYLDGSTVYGYSPTRAAQLRTWEGGLLRMLNAGGREMLPPSIDPNDGCNTAEMNAKGRYCFETGDDRANENLHLTTMHLLWARQHNRLARILHQLNPRWDDERLYQEARKIVGAQMQHISYNEFLPLVLGSDVMWALNLTLQRQGHSSAYNPHVDASMANHFSAAAFRFAHTLLPGLIHMWNANNNSLDYVHLHEMLFNPYMLYTLNGARGSVSSAISTPVHSVDPHVTDELSNHLFEHPTTANSTAPHPCGLDLVSLNIQRGRDHGLPPYPAWREHCGFSRPRSFQELRGVFNEVSWGRISTIYRHVDDIDLYTGALAEEPHGRLLGPTLTCLLADQFLRVKIGDRYWYETDDQTTGFTIEQLTEIRKTTLAGVICANEQLLGQAQPRVMELVSETNPLLPCRSLPQPAWRPWKE